MTIAEQRQLDELVTISEERDSPMSDWEKEFVISLDGRDVDRPLTLKQAEVFDRLVAQHLRGDR